MLLLRVRLSNNPANVPVTRFVRSFDLLYIGKRSYFICILYAAE